MRDASQAHLIGEVDEPSPRRPAECPVEGWLSFLGHRWNALALWHLSRGAKRFGELTALLPGVTAKVLTERLAGLEQRGLIARRDVAMFPRAVVYELTLRGAEIVAILDQIDLWAKRSGEGA